MHLLLKKFLFILETDERIAFSDSIAKYNAQRLIPVALATIVLEIAMLIRAVVRAPTFEDGRLIYFYIGLYIAMLVVVITALIYYRVYAKRPAQFASMVERVVGFVACFTLLWAAAITVLDFLRSGQVAAFVSMQYVASILFLLPPVYSLVVQVSAEALFMLGLLLYAPNTDALSSVFTNTAISMMMAWIISRMLYGGYLEQFRASRVIEAQNRELAALSITDPLTRLMNRRSFDETLFREWKNASRDGEALMIAMTDVDDFKNYNDVYGHLDGDACLVRIADTLRAQLKRPSDVVARFGGEEFIILIRSMGEEKDRLFLEQIRSAVEKLQIKHSGSKSGAHVTVSVGGYSIAPSSLDSSQDAIQDAIKDAVQRADAALYEAKAAGRNRVVLHAALQAAEIIA